FVLSVFFFSSRRRHTRSTRDWSSDVCSSDLHLVEEILRLDPNSVRHRQQQVEYAFKSGDKAKLIEAYLELADTLLRQDLPDKARSEERRVGEGWRDRGSGDQLTKMENERGVR